MLTSFKQALNDTMNKKKEIDTMNNWFKSLDYETKKIIYNKHFTQSKRSVPTPQVCGDALASGGMASVPAVNKDTSVNSPVKGSCQICGKKVNKNFVWCKEHYPKQKQDDEVIRI